MRAGRAEGQAEERNSRIQTHPCLCVKSQPICAPQDTRRWWWGGAVRAGVWLPQSIWASFCLSVSASARSPSDWQLTMSFTATQTGILPGRGRAVIKWPPRGTGCSTVIQLEPRCQAGPRPATKARLFHGPDSTAGRDGGALGNPSLGSAELSVWPSLNYVNTHFFKKCNNEAIA